jgi:hypothetical protein
MKKLNRRTFLTVAGTSTAAAATGAVITSANLLTGQTNSEKNGTLTFRAVAGLPSRALPAYASYVIEGHVNLATNSGIITKTLFAGDPKGMSAIAFPGQSRIMSVTSVEDLGGAYRIRGMVNDRSLLQRGESPTFDIVINPAQRTARTSLAGSELVMNLEP